ncbi:MAG: ribosome-associated translation inhibitor RaiA [Candidatus Latescibacterota bacterium]
MQVQVSVRNTRISEETREHIHQVCSRLEHFCEHILDCEVVVDGNRDKIGFGVELVVKVPSQVLTASAIGESVHKALGEAHDKLEEQLRRHHDRLVTHR